MNHKIGQNQWNSIAANPSIRTGGNGGGGVDVNKKQYVIDFMRWAGTENLPPFLWGRVVDEYANTLKVDIYSYAEQAVTHPNAIVLKPFHLRRDDWNGKTVTYSNGDVIEYNYDSGVWGVRTATLDPSGTPVSITQEVAPDYAASEHILLAKVGAAVTSDGFTDIIYHDINTAARGWATAVDL